MGIKSRYEYLKEILLRYKYATRTQKKNILDEFCTNCGYNRKYAIRLLNLKNRSRPQNVSKRGRKKFYHDPLIAQVLSDIWVVSNLACAKRLKAMIPLFLPHYKKYILSKEIKEKLLKISPATIDRLMAPSRAKFAKKGLATTKPGSIIKKQIPIKTNQWNETVPGFIEADTVAHCGSTVAGMFVYSLNCVDIASGWTEQRAVWGKGERGVLEAIIDIEKNIPFPIKGFDCDNGSEFLNWHLLRHLTERKQPVQFTRARPYHKNDNAHIENKNWTHIRQYLGYQRFEQQNLVEKLNELYTSEWNDFHNYFSVSVKLISKNRVGSKITKTYDDPKTPVQRLLESEHISNQTKVFLSQKFQQLDPFQLQEQMACKIKRIIKNVSKYNEKNLNQK